MENILVAGANGTTGRKIIQLLNESQYFNPIAMVRKEEQKVYFKGNNIETILADLEDDITPAFETKNAIDKVIFAAGSGGKKVVEVDQDGAKKLIEASNKNNIKKFVMLSSMGADNPEEMSELKDYLEAKHNADIYLKESGLNYSIVRPGALTNNHASNTIELEEKLNKRGEISRNDVAQILVRTLNDGIANKQTFEIINGETLIAKALDKVSN